VENINTSCTDKMNILYSVINRISSEKLRVLVNKYVVNTVRDVSKCTSLEEAPGEILEHHSYPCGLIEHTLSVTLISESIASIIKVVYGINVNIDLVRACAILHDIYKVYEFEFKNGKITRCSSYYPHDALISSRILIEDGERDLAKCIIEVHGYYDYTSIESLLVGLADQYDARFHETIQSKIFNMLEATESQSIEKLYGYLKKGKWRDKRELENIMKTLIKNPLR